MSYYIAMDREGNYDLAHHGIKGMKWGVRRYQNPDGSLTPAGRKKYSSDYKKTMIKYQLDQAKAAEKIYVDSYNKTADEYNKIKIDEYNRHHKPTDPDYIEGYERQFQKDWIQNYNRQMMEFSRNNKYFKRGEEIAEKYGLYEFDELAKANKAFIDEIINSGYTLSPNDLEKQRK